MEGITIRYSYDGEEAAWQAVIDTFLAALANDPEVAGFRYAVNIAKDGKTRIHVGRWDSEQTLQTLQSRDYFKNFADELGKLAGDSLDPVRVTLNRETQAGA